MQERQQNPTACIAPIVPKGSVPGTAAVVSAVGVGKSFRIRQKSAPTILQQSSTASGSAIGFVPAGQVAATAKKVTPATAVETPAMKFRPMNAANELATEGDSQKQERELLCSFHSRWADALALECTVCTTERARRKRVMDDTETSLSPEFALAPFVTAMNKPRYLASQQRARLSLSFTRRKCCGSRQKTSQSLAKLPLTPRRS